MYTLDISTGDLDDDLDPEILRSAVQNKEMRVHLDIQGCSAGTCRRLLASKMVWDLSVGYLHDDEVEGPAWMGVCEPDQPWNELSEEERGMLLRSWFFAPRRTVVVLLRVESHLQVSSCGAEYVCSLFLP